MRIYQVHRWVLPLIFYSHLISSSELIDISINILPIDQAHSLLVECWVALPERAEKGADCSPSARSVKSTQHSTSRKRACSTYLTNKFCILTDTSMHNCQYWFYHWTLPKGEVHWFYWNIVQHDHTALVIILCLFSWYTFQVKLSGPMSVVGRSVVIQIGIKAP